MLLVIEAIVTTLEAVQFRVVMDAANMAMGRELPA